MVDCREVRKWFPDYLNGKLDTELAQHLRWHIGHCKECKVIVRSARETFAKYFSASETRETPGSAARATV